MAPLVVSPPSTDPVTGPVRSAREAVAAELWDKQVGLLMRDWPYDSVMAARVLGQGYAYLLTAMKHRGEALGRRVPSRVPGAVAPRVRSSCWRPCTGTLAPPACCPA